MPSVTKQVWIQFLFCSASKRMLLFIRMHKRGPFASVLVLTSVLILQGSLS